MIFIPLPSRQSLDGSPKPPITGCPNPCAHDEFRSEIHTLQHMFRQESRRSADRPQRMSICRNCNRSSGPERFGGDECNLTANSMQINASKCG
jgi:hypothetical protein